jgi:hypothetical protein
MISTRWFLDILVWLDINKTTICCIKTLRHILIIIEVLVCLVRVFVDDFSLRLLSLAGADAKTGLAFRPKASNQTRLISLCHFLGR